MAITSPLPSRPVMPAFSSAFSLSGNRHQGRKSRVHRALQPNLCDQAVPTPAVWLNTTVALVVNARAEHPSGETEHTEFRGPHQHHLGLVVGFAEGAAEPVVVDLPA